MDGWFVYLLDPGAERLVLRATSAPYASLVARIGLARGEGLAWWASEPGEPAFSRESALAGPHVKYLPECEGEHFIARRDSQPGSQRRDRLDHTRDKVLAQAFT